MWEMEIVISGREEAGGREGRDEVGLLDPV